MANFDQLKQSVAALIRTNGAEEITGQIMQDVLLTIINSISGGYMFGGVAQHSGNVGNPDYNVFYLAGSGAYTGYGDAINIPNGCYGVFRYNGSWTQDVVDIGVHLTGTIREGETNGVTGDVINTALQQLFNNIMNILDTLTFTYNTPSGQQATKAMLDVIVTPTGGASHVLTTLTLVSATAAAAGLMSAEDKQKVDRMLTDFRSLSFSDTTAVADQATKIVQTLSATLGENPEAITTMTFLAATASKAGLLSAADKAKLDALWSSGYQFAGIATPSTTPISTTSKIFYFATEEGTYFNAVTITQGINILSWNGTSWSAVQVVGIDDEVKRGSTNLIESGAVHSSFESIKNDISTNNVLLLAPSSTISGKFSYNGTLVSNSDFSIKVYDVDGDKEYLFTDTFGPSVNIYFIEWYDEDNNYISSSTQKGTGETTVAYVDESIFSPKNAKYMYLNFSSNGIVKAVARDIILSSDLKRDADNSRLGLSVPSTALSLNSSINNKFIYKDGTQRDNNYTKVLIYNVDGNTIYAASTGVTTSGYGGLYIFNWFDSDGKFIGGDYYKEYEIEIPVLNQALLVSPKNAAYLYVNAITDKEDAYAVYMTTSSMMQNEKRTINSVKDLILLGEKEEMVPTIVTGKYIDDGILTTDSRFDIWEYSVNGGDSIMFSGVMPSGYIIHILSWFDADDNMVLQEQYRGSSSERVEFSNIVLVPPVGARYLKVNTHNNYTTSYKVRLLNSNGNRIDSMQNAVARKVRVDYTPTSTIEDSFTNNGTISINSAFEIKVYEIDDTKDYYVKGEFGPSVGIRFVEWYNEDNEYIGYGQFGGGGGIAVRIEDARVIPPTGAKYLYLNVQKNKSFWGVYDLTTEYISSGAIEQSIASVASRRMKVVISSMGYDSTSFYIRTRYNSTKDIILKYYTNGNSLISPHSAYVGANNLTDEELLGNTYLVSSHSDSTAPFFKVTQYWHLFAQHGYPIPYFANSVGMTSSDVGAEWVDNLGRHYTIGKVTSSYIYLLPVIYQDANNHYVRDWKNTASSESSNLTLTHVSGGSYTTTISNVTFSQDQLRPVMKHEDRKFVVGINEITEPGTYYCDEFKVSESQIGYDPATITSWFPVNLVGAEPLALFTWSYSFKGAQCCVNTTVDIRREIECECYGATQQQFFYDKGNYKAMFMIPKAASRNGVEIDKPFNSPSSSSTSYSIYRITSHLKDVNDPVDRQIGYLYNEDTGDYLVGMAAGLSLVSGDTVTEKRIQNCPIGSTDEHYRIMLFSPLNINKFYIAAINAAPYADNDYYFPTTLFKEINYYVCYFDPAENTGQVYWYKDGNDYVIYAHCQSAQNRLAINVPEFMEGLKLSVVEKTSNAQLLTDTIQNGKFFVNYNSADANYIVLKTK